MNFRPATPDDAEALAHVHIDSWRAAYRGLVPDSVLDGMDYNRRAKQFHDSLSSLSEETYVIELDGEVPGFLTVGKCRDNDLNQETTGEIWGIYIAPTVWRSGYGRFLAQQALQILQSRNYSLAVLWVLERNDQARLFYEAMGFTKDGAEKTITIGAPLRVIRYRRPL
jgi:ribosomal protein S18 acetylase RimI-like enzyme